jgi:Tfp pilus tip-associated adhesin PilY1
LLYLAVRHRRSLRDGSHATVARSHLAAQTINVNSGTITGTAVSYAAAAGSSRRDGWFVDLPRAGERMVGLPLVQRGRLIFPALIPDDDKGAGGGTSSIMVLASYNGSGLAQWIFLAQPAVDFIASTVGIVGNLVDIGTGNHAYLYAGGASGSVQVEEVRPFQQAAGRGRVSWRQIVR